MDVVATDQACGDSADSCICIRAPRHHVPHVCACRHAWGLVDGHLRAYAFPAVTLPHLSGREEADAYAQTLTGPLTLPEILILLAQGLLELGSAIPPDATVADLRNMTIGDLDARSN